MYLIDFSVLLLTLEDLLDLFGVEDGAKEELHALHWWHSLLVLALKCSFDECFEAFHEEVRVIILFASAEICTFYELIQVGLPQLAQYCFQNNIPSVDLQLNESSIQFLGGGSRLVLGWLHLLLLDLICQWRAGGALGSGLALAAQYESIGQVFLVCQWGKIAFKTIFVLLGFGLFGFLVGWRIRFCERCWFLKLFLYQLTRRKFPMLVSRFDRLRMEVGGCQTWTDVENGTCDDGGWAWFLIKWVSMLVYPLLGYLYRKVRVLSRQ